ncbi:MFS transporter [Sinomonas atrocyanea]
MAVTKEGAQQTAPGTIPDRVLMSIGFLSFFDRFATPPMLVVLAARTGLTLAEAVGLVAAYSLLYALGQPVWGFISDRFGRVAVLRTALVGLALAAVASTLFSAHAPLLVARSAAGLMAGCLYPTLLTIIGDTRSGVAKARGLSELQVYSALGTTAATLAAGSIAAFTDWRVVFGLPALGCLALLVLLRRAHDGGAHRRGPVDFRAAFSGAALGVYGVAVLEGAVLMGVLTYFVPALQHADVPIALAGVLAAGYGVGVIAGARLMRRLVQRLSHAAHGAGRDGPAGRVRGVVGRAESGDHHGHRGPRRRLERDPALLAAGLGHRGRARGEGHGGGPVRVRALPRQLGGHVPHRAARGRRPVRGDLPARARLHGGARRGGDGRARGVGTASCAVRAAAAGTVHGQADAPPDPSRPVPPGLP